MQNKNIFLKNSLNDSNSKLLSLGKENNTFNGRNIELFKECEFLKENNVILQKDIRDSKVVF